MSTRSITREARSLLPRGDDARHPLPREEGRHFPLPLPRGEGCRFPLPLPWGEGRGEGALSVSRRDAAFVAPRLAALNWKRRSGFTVVELLVTMSIIGVLMALFAAAISAARNGSQENATQNAIARLDQIVMTQFRRYESRSVSRGIVGGLRAVIPNPAAARAWFIRRNMITADMPDRWSDVAYMASGTTGFPQSPAQAAYIATWNAMAKKPSDQYGGAECLFMIIMQGGFADCLDCKGLAQLKKGDFDGDGALEFWDDWGNPIDYILWAPAYQRSGDAVPFFSPLDNAFPSSGSVRPGLGMRPLIYSAGPDGIYGLNRDQESDDQKSATDNGARTYNSNLLRESNPSIPAANPAGAPLAPPMGGGDREDNIANVEAQVTL